MTKSLFPESQSQWLAAQLSKLGYHQEQASELAQAILELSTHYQTPESITPWGQDAIEGAYLAYFYPLNYMRLQKVFNEALRQGFLEPVREVVDFGAGPGPLTQLLLEWQPSHSLESILAVDSHPQLAKYFNKLSTPNLKVAFSSQPPAPATNSQQALMASYAFNELKILPPWLWTYDHILIVEPSTQTAFANLLKLRTEMIQRGYQVLAPCPHQDTCPLAHRKGDWCHDALSWEPPSWFQNVEAKLPMKNQTLSFSYLIATRKPSLRSPEKAWRIVGDARKEKGKTRWQVCHDDKRRFLSHLKRSGPAPELNRGDLLHLNEFQEVGDEVRFAPKDLKSLDHSQQS